MKKSNITCHCLHPVLHLAPYIIFIHPLSLFSSLYLLVLVGKQNKNQQLLQERWRQKKVFSVVSLLRLYLSSPQFFFSLHPVCKAAKADLVFLIDGSWSIGDDNFLKIIRFLYSTTGALDQIGPDGTQVPQTRGQDIVMNVAVFLTTAFLTLCVCQLSHHTVWLTGYWQGGTEQKYHRTDTEQPETETWTFSWGTATCCCVRTDRAKRQKRASLAIHCHDCCFFLLFDALCPL